VGWVNSPPDRLKYLVGRYYAEHEIPLIGKPSLTKRIVYEQSYGWRKTDKGIIFTAIRYPVNQKFGNSSFDEVHQTWEVNIKSLSFIFLSEEWK